jgi:peroxiredoxin
MAVMSLRRYCVPPRSSRQSPDSALSDAGRQQLGKVAGSATLASTMPRQCRVRQQEPLSFTLLSDTDRKIGLAYGACADPGAGYPMRISYLIDEQGKIAACYPKVNPAEHASQVLADVASA